MEMNPEVSAVPGESEVHKQDESTVNDDENLIKHDDEEFESTDSEWETLADPDQKKRKVCPFYDDQEEIRYKQLMVLLIFLDKSVTPLAEPELLANLKSAIMELYFRSPLKASGTMLPLDWNMFVRCVCKFMDMLSLNKKLISNLILPLANEKELLVSRVKNLAVPYQLTEDEKIFQLLRDTQPHTECMEWIKMGRRHLSSYKGKFGLVINKVRKNRSPRSYACRK